MRFRNESTKIYKYTHTHTDKTFLRLFFQDHPGEPVPEIF